MPDRLNQLSAGELLTELYRCCGSDDWADAFLQQRPFADDAAVFAAADAAFDSLTTAQWHDAIRASALHGPGIGDKATCAATRTALQLYETRYGHPFVAVTSSAAADELLMRVRIRLGNDHATEWRITCDELRRLTRLRLQRLFATVLEQ